MDRDLPYLTKYDTSYEYPISMYDNLPYKRDSDYCNAEHLGLYSGKIIKYFSCHNETDNFVINNHDEDMQTLLSQLKEQQLLQAQQEEADDAEVVSPDEITEEQIQTLIEDQGDTEESEEGVNAFSDVEDW